jgi:hypothetical protein
MFMSYSLDGPDIMVGTSAIYSGSTRYGSSEVYEEKCVKGIPMPKKETESQLYNHYTYNTGNATTKFR